MKTLNEYISESLDVLTVGYGKVSKYTSALDTAAIKDSLKNHKGVFKYKFGVKPAPKVWNDLFTVLADEIDFDKSFRENLEVLSKYFSDKFILPEEGSYDYHNSAALYENGTFLVNLGKPSQRVYLSIRRD